MRVALVTGGSGGIGAGIVQRLAHDGFAVAFTAHSDAHAASLLRERVRANGGAAECFPADVSREDDVGRLFEEVHSNLGPLDVIVSNAGVWPRARVCDMSTDDWDHVIATNLRSTFLVCRAAARDFRARRYAGRIVTVSSGAASRGAVDGAHYAASKAAIVAFTKSLALELAPDRILVNCVAPGTVDTPMPRLGMTEAELAERARSFIPLGRIGTPDDVAEVVAFLLNERLTWMTGQTIWLNGGDLMP
ncbi:MAG: SDR family oxidoreductase [Chloroflexi bacterium]|nr:SDR family oxidoreductase [Chloroflexota bacterium]